MKKTALIISVLLLTACGSVDNINNTVETEKPLAITEELTDKIEDTALENAPEEKRNSLFDDVSPETSALHFFFNDGVSSKDMYLFNNSREHEIFDSLSAVSALPADGWSYDMLRSPIYAIENGKKDGRKAEYAWSDGYLITTDGSVYSFDYDFGKLMEENTWELETEGKGIAWFPCAEYMLKSENGWNIPFMQESVFTEEDEGISVSCESTEGNMLTVSLQNFGEKSWEYGVTYSLEAEVDGKWCSMPYVSGENWGFIAIGYVLMPDETSTLDNDLTMYGHLPDGHYRIIISGGYYDEFDVSDGKIILKDD